MYALLCPSSSGLVNPLLCKSAQPAGVCTVITNAVAPFGKEKIIELTVSGSELGTSEVVSPHWDGTLIENNSAESIKTVRPPGATGCETIKERLGDCTRVSEPENAADMRNVVVPTGREENVSAME